jgi:hypothetical protein
VLVGILDIDEGDRRLHCRQNPDTHLAVSLRSLHIFDATDHRRQNNLDRRFLSYPFACHRTNFTTLGWR